jgi:transposase
MGSFHQNMSLVPNGLVVESETYLDDSIQLTVRAIADVAACPSCGGSSRRVHSRYIRNVSDLPCSGRAVHLRVVTRRFRCQAAHCPRRISASGLGTR